MLGQNLSVAGKVFEFDRPINLIGRGKDCTVVVLDPSVSRMHTKISVDEDGRLRVEDLRSSNGTSLNDQRIDNAYLKHGDRLRVGNVEFLVELSEEARSSVDADIGRAQGAKGLVAWMVLISLVMGGLGFGTWYFFLRPDPMAPAWFASFEGDDGLAKRVDRIVSSVKSSYIEDKLDEATALVKAQEFSKAAATYEGLTAVVPQNEDVMDGIKAVTMELKAKKDYGEAIALLKKENYAKALKLFRGIPKKSAFFVRAENELKDLSAMKDEIKRVGQGYCKSGKKVECLNFLKQAAAIDPDDKALAAQIEKLQ
jgi:hypothetical protein